MAKTSHLVLSCKGRREGQACLRLAEQELRSGARAASPQHTAPLGDGSVGKDFVPDNAAGDTLGPKGGRTGVKRVKMGLNEILNKHVLMVLG